MSRLLSIALLALAVTACGDNNNHNTVDSGTPIDASQPDASIDAGSGSGSGSDMGSGSGSDMGSGSGSGSDMGSGDGIADALAAADGSGLTLPITGVTVTYVKPAINPPEDPAGFTVQSQQDGPGLFVAVDPATLSPALSVGDVVSFTVTEMGTDALQRRALAISDVTRSATGSDVSLLARDVSNATDLVTNVVGYDSTIVSLTGAFGSAFSSSGTGFQAAQLTTAGIPTGSFSFTFRVPSALVDERDMVATCSVTATNVPVSEYGSSGSSAEAEIDAYADADFTLSGCPAPTVTKVVASDDNHVLVTFSRHIDAATVDPSEFTITTSDMDANPVTVTAASVSGRTVTLTTTDQTSATAYTLTIDQGSGMISIADTLGSPLAVPVSEPLDGYEAPATVLINEVNASLSSSCDLIELLVTGDGSLGQFTLSERIGYTGKSGELGFTFPPGLQLVAGDVVVVHVKGVSGVASTCNGGGATNEMVGSADQPHATYGNNFDDAWDFYAGDDGLTATDNVISLLDPAGNPVDVVFFTSGTGATDTLAAANALGAGQWATGSTPYTAATFAAAAVQGFGSSSTSVTGASFQRTSTTDTNTAADWTLVAPSTWGSASSGEGSAMGPIHVVGHRR